MTRRIGNMMTPNRDAASAAPAAAPHSAPDPDKNDLAPDTQRVLRILGVGGRIALARQNKGWTQRELSERLGKSRGTIVQYEQGRIEPPLRQIETIANLLEVAPELLAFGRQGIEGLGSSAAELAAIPEVEFVDGKEGVIGACGLSPSLIQALGADRYRAKAVVLGHAVPAFGFAAGDRLIVNSATGFDQEDKLYALRTRRGVDIVRLVPSLSSRDDAVKINDGSGQTHSYERGELDVMGRVVGSIRAE
jgi:transcriptional regulator with XRE-family HTH domain